MRSLLGCDIHSLKHPLDSRFERIEGELKLNCWMMGVMLAGVLSLVLKAFFSQLIGAHAVCPTRN